jgi:hypothetical protein
MVSLFLRVTVSEWISGWTTGKIGKATLNDKFQYGQKDADGTDRFIVYHDQNNKPYQAGIFPVFLSNNADVAQSTASCTRPRQ